MLLENNTKRCSMIDKRSNSGFFFNENLVSYTKYEIIKHLVDFC